jgi:hypothetical protein
MIMKKIEIYLLALEYYVNISLLTNRKATKAPSTSKYLTQKRPSFTTIDSLFLHAITTIIIMKRMRKLREILYIAEGPMHP